MNTSLPRTILIPTLKNTRSLPKPQAKTCSLGVVSELQGQKSQNKVAGPGTAGISQSLLPSTALISPQQLLQLCLPSLLQLQLLLDDLLHPGCIGLGSLPPHQVHPLQLVFLLQECLQDPPISCLDEGV